MTPSITAIYAALLAVFFIAMSFHVIVARARTGVLLGHGNNQRMLAAMRRHGNMAEYVPFALLMMAFAENLGLAPVWLHTCGIALVAGRLAHPFGITEGQGPLAPRVAGVLATMAAILIPAGSILLNSLI